MGRLIGIRVRDNSPISIRYNAAGRRDQIQYPGGISGRYEYDASGRMATLAWQRPDGSELERFTYGYDGRGNIVRKTDARGATDYQYDPLSRLTRESGPDLTAEYTYDDDGNRLRRTVTISGRQETTDYRYDAANRLLQAGSRTYTWDVRGNQLGDGEQAYRYDGLDRLVAVTAPGGREIRYAYNGDGLQVTRQVGGETTRLYWDRGQVVMETDDNGHLTGRTTFAGGPLLREVPGQGIAYTLFDAHGDVRQLVSATGGQLAAYRYDAFGDPMTTSGEFPNPFRYAGEMWDEEAGLYYLRSRHYAPATGRFVSQDSYRGTVWQPWTQHLYAHVGNEPVGYIDPTGHKQMNVGSSGSSSDWAGCREAWVEYGCVTHSGAPLKYLEMFGDQIRNFQKANPETTEAINTALAVATLGAAVKGSGLSLRDQTGSIRLPGGGSNAPTLPPRVIVREQGVLIEQYYRSADHPTAHMHIRDMSGNATKIGPNGKPIRGYPELSAEMSQVVLLKPCIYNVPARVFWPFLDRFVA